MILQPDSQTILSLLLSTNKPIEMKEPTESNLQGMETLQKSAELSEAARLEGNDILKKKSEHNKKEHREMLFQYTKSIAYAPNESEELAVGYGNRSFLLSHLKMYQASITDIDRALKITKSNVLRAKLMCRKIAAMKCMNKRVPQPMIDEAKEVIKTIEDNGKTKLQLEDSFKKAINQKPDRNYHQFTNIDLPSIRSNEDLPATSSSINMEYSKNLGRHYKAAKNISAGEVLISEQPYTAVPRIEHLYVTCSFCLDFAWTGIPCDNCPCAIYCSEQCKEAAWKLFHQLECPIIAIIAKEIFAKVANMTRKLDIHVSTEKFLTLNNLTLVLLTLRIFIKGFKDSNENLNKLLQEFLLAKNAQDERSKGFKNNIFSSENIRAIFSLTSHFELYKNNHISPSLQKLIRILNTKFGQSFSTSESHSSLKNYNIYTFKDFMTYIFCVAKINAYTYYLHHCTCGPITRFEQLDYHKNVCLVDMGKSIGACQSLVNHSCIPNTSKMLKNGKIIFFAMRAITKNEQICYSYNPNYTDALAGRQQYLESEYHFKCGCIACKDRWDMSTIDMRSQILTGFSYFGANFLKEVNQFVQDIYHKKETILKKDMKKLLDELKLKIAKVYQSNSLYEASLICSLIPDLFTSIYIGYYGGDDYVPSD